MPFEGDERLVKDLKSGKQKAFDEIVLKYKDKIFNTAYRFLGEWQDANDLTQETFIAVYKNIRKFRGESAVSTWIYRIAVNLCKNKLGSLENRNREKTVSVDEKILNIKNKNDTPHKLLEKKELEITVQKAIDSLPADWKDVVVLKDIEDMPYEEIASVLNCEVGTVKSRLHRARMALREKLAGLVE